METINFKSIDSKEEYSYYEKFLFSKFLLNANINGCFSNINSASLNDRKLKNNTPFFKQKVYLAKEYDKIIAAVTINYNINEKMFIEDVGFNIKKDNKICEALNLYLDENLGMNFIKILLKMQNDIINDLKKRKIKYLYGSCNDKLINLFKLIFDFQIIDFKYKNMEKIYLLKFTVPLINS